MNNSDNDNPVWERQPWDTTPSYNAFHKFYLSQDPIRSLDKAYRDYIGRERRASGALIRCCQCWRHWSLGRNWKGEALPGALTWAQRAQAFDDHVASQNLAKWMKRREQARERDWTQAESLRKLADDIIAEGVKFVKTTKRVIPGQPAVVDAHGNVREQGRAEREIITVALNGPLAISAIQTGSRLSRLALGQLIEVESPNGDTQITFAEMSDEELVQQIVQLRISRTKSGIAGNNISGADNGDE